MNKLRQTAARCRLLSLLPHATKCRSKAVAPAPAALKASHSTAASAASFGLLALAIAPLVFTMPAHASDKISISLGNNSVSMQKSAGIYDSSSSVAVHNSNDYGFSLSMHATNPDLVNDSYPEYRINPVTGANGQLGANQWGYNLDGSNRFSKVPGSSSEAVSIASVSSDNKGNCSSLKDCSFNLNFGANINPKKMVSGTYSTYVVYTATSKPAPVQPSTPSSSGSSSGGSSSDSWWSICYSRYPSDNDKRSYCYIHNGDMSGYWNEVCSKRFPGSDSRSLELRSSCIEHEGYVAYYGTAYFPGKPDWNKICSETYSGSDEDSRNKRSECIAHEGRVHEYNWNAICRNRYPGSDTDSSNKRTYCAEHKGSMSGYLDWLCGGLYSGDNDKISYCKDHNGDMSGYEDYYWDNTCSAEYIFEDNKIAYCKDHHGNMSGYLDWLCGGWYPGNDDETVFVKRPYCIAHDGDMSGYIRPSQDDICRAKYPGNDSYSMQNRLTCIVGH